MTIENFKISEIFEYENNPRLNDETVRYVAKSIEKFGFKVPIIVDKDHVIVTGHARYKAAMMLGLDTVPCVVADDLSDEKIAAFRLADNRVSQFSTWDDKMLEEELNELTGDAELRMAEFGFEDEKKIAEESEPDDEDESVSAGKKFKHKCPKCNFEW